MRDGDTIIDEVLVSLFKGPRSYTKEDTIEISCHGSPYVLQQVVKLLHKKGARLAKPGEFTQRAFLNGRFDRAQAEAVADLISAENSCCAGVCRWVTHPRYYVLVFCRICQSGIG